MMNALLKSIGALILKLRLTKLRKFSRRQPAQTAGDSKTQVVSVTYLKSLSRHLLRPIGIGPLCFPFTKFIVVLYLLKKTST